MLEEKGKRHQELAQTNEGTIILLELSGTLGIQRVCTAHVGSGEGSKLGWRKPGGDNGGSFQLLT
jgi:hypothetical protein